MREGTRRLTPSVQLEIAALGDKGCQGASMPGVMWPDLEHSPVCWF